MVSDQRRLLITGANGLLGSKISKLSADFTIIPTHRTQPLQADSLKLDLASRKEVTDTIAKLQPEIVIHTASETNVDKCEIEKEHAWKVNVEGTRNIAQACQKVKAKLVFISTDYVFDGKRGFYNEEDYPVPLNYYGITKLEAEKEVARNCNDHVILRTSVLYGWHPWKVNFATWVINKLKKSQEIKVVEDHINTPTLVDNLAEITLETAEKDLRGLYHASGSQRINRFEFAKQIAITFNLNSDLVGPIKMNELTSWVAKRPRDSSLDTGKIQKQLIAKPLNIMQGLQILKEEMEA